MPAFNLQFMKHTHLLGNLPTYKSGPNKGRLDRQKAAKKLGLSYDALHKGYNNWCQTFRMSESSLTLEQYFIKLSEAKITVFDLGNNIGKYNLARYNDIGPYTNISCRFVKVEENLEEQYRETPYQKTLRKFGKEAARLQNSKSARKGWAKRKAKMSVDGKRCFGHVSRAAKAPNF